MSSRVISIVKSHSEIDGGSNSMDTNTNENLVLITKSYPFSAVSESFLIWKYLT